MSMLMVISESDVVLAAASNALIIGFNIRPNNKIVEYAKEKGVDIRLYNIIYKVVEEMEAAMKGKLEPLYEEKVLGQAEVRKLFKFSKVGTIAGSYVSSGIIKRDAKARVIRDSVIIYDGNINSIAREKDQVKVVKTGAGSAMMLKEDESVEIVKAIIENVDKPVTVKMRLGYTLKNMNYLSLAKKLEDVGVSAIGLHARTRGQMYDGHADWSHIKKLKEELNIPVFGNGDVKTVKDFIIMKEQTGCDGVMIGRGVVGNPFLIKQISNYLEGKDNIEISIDDRFNYCLSHASKLVSLKGEKLGISEMRGLAPHYISGLYDAAKYKEKMNRIESYSDLVKILEDYRKELI